MKCEHCGAPSRDEGAFCSHCGGRFKRTETPGYLAVVAPARFEQAEAHPGHAAACAHKPAERPTFEVAGPMIGLLATLLGMCFLLFIAVEFGTLDKPGVLVPYLLLVLTMVGSFIALSVVLRRVLAERSAPIERGVRVVVDERTGVVGGKNPRTNYFATLQTRDGARVEHKCEEWLAARIANGDIGVAFMQAGRLLDFVRIEV